MLCILLIEVVCKNEYIQVSWEVHWLCKDVSDGGELESACNIPTIRSIWDMYVVEKYGMSGHHVSGLMVTF